MGRHVSDFPTDWTLRLPSPGHAPTPLRLRAETLPARSYFARHSHRWHQFAHAVEGVLTVSTAQARHVITPKQGIWLPAGIAHSVGTNSGASFRSLYVAADAMTGQVPGQQVLAVSPLLRCLVLELAALECSGVDQDAGYISQVEALILVQLTRAKAAPVSLPWPADSKLLSVSEALLARPGDCRPMEYWAKNVGLSKRTFLRRFQVETGLSYRDWRVQLRLLSALELLDSGANVTQTAYVLGYTTPSSFVHMFRQAMGMPPQAYRRQLL